MALKGKDFYGVSRLYPPSSHATEARLAKIFYNHAWPKMICHIPLLCHTIRGLPVHMHLKVYYVVDASGTMETLGIESTSITWIATWIQIESDPGYKAEV